MGSKGDPSDDVFAQELARIDEEWVAGTPSLPSGDSNVSPGLPTNDDRVVQAASALFLLESVWPRKSAGGSDEKPLSEPRFPRMFGRFEIRRELGRGGFGVVFEAFDPSLGREIALKVPRPEVLLSPVLADRFFAEARLSAQLNHPYIVHVHEAGEIGPTCYVASELCRGPNLATWLARRQGKPIPIKDAARVVAVIAEAAAYALRKGILHRDLKPSNVLLEVPAPDDMIGAARDVSMLGFTPKLSDFGLAKLLEARTENTLPGSIIGTPEYMSPEQAEGQLDEIGPATDVYSLGAILFEMLTGRPPIEGTTDLDRLRRVVSDQPPDVRRLRADVPMDLEAICRKCLEKDPRQRYENAEHLAKDLRRFLAGLPTVARPLVPTVRGWRWAKRHPSQAILIGTFGLFATIAALGSWVHHEQMVSAKAETEQARADVAVSEQTSEQQFSRLAELEYVANIRLAQQAHENADVAETIARLTALIPAPGEIERRGFEWGRLWHLCKEGHRVLAGHGDAVYHVAYLPDGTRLLAGSADGQLHLWDLASGKATILDPPHLGEVNMVAVSADGRWLASCSDDTTIQLRDGAGKLVRTLRGNTRQVTAIAFDPQGRFLFSGSREGTLHRWDLPSGESVRTWSSNGLAIESIAIAPDGQQVVFGGTDGKILLVRSVDSDDPSEHKFSIHSTVNIITWLPGTSSVVIGGRDDNLTRFNLETEEVEWSILAHRDWVQNFACDPSGAWGVSVSRDESIKVWNLSDGRRLARTLGHIGRIWGVAIRGDGKQFATAGDDGTVRLWDTKQVGEDRVLCTTEDRCVSLSPGPGPQEVTVGFDNGVIERWNVATGERVLAGRIDAPIVSIDGTADGETAIVSDSGKISLGRLEEKGWQPAAETSIEFPADVALRPQGGIGAASSRDGHVQTFDVATGKIRQRKRLHEWSVRLKFTRDGLALLSYSDDASIRLLDPETLATRATTKLHEHSVLSIALSPDGQFLASASADARAVLAHFPTGRAAAVLQGRQQEIVGVFFSKEGRTVITGDRDGWVRMWNTVTCQEMIAEDTKLDEIDAMCMTPDGRHLVLSGREEMTENFAMIVWTATPLDTPLDSP